MRIATNHGTMELDDDKIATTDDINDMACAMMNHAQFDLWCGCAGEDGLCDGDTVALVAAKLRLWINKFNQH